MTTSSSPPSSPLLTSLFNASDITHISSSPSPAFQASRSNDIQNFDEVHETTGDRDVGDTSIETITTQERLQEVVDTFRRVGWSFKQFLLAWIGERVGSQDILLKHRQYHTMLQRRKLLLDVAAELNDNCSVADKIAHELDYFIK